MEFGLNGKVAMVAAASKGIGFAIAQELVAEGCRVSICARDIQALNEAVSRLGASAVGIACDVSKKQELQDWLDFTREKLGQPDILVTNTGGPPAGLAGEMSDDQWQTGFENTLLNVVRLVRMVSPGMREKGWGRIVHITSLVAKEASDLLPISSTLRSGLMSLTKLQARELAAFGITVNSVLPGHTLTDRQRHLAGVRASREGIDVEEAMRLQEESLPMKRFADPSEVAAAVAFLCSSRASYVSGVSLLVDGGTTLSAG